MWNKSLFNCYNSSAVKKNISDLQIWFKKQRSSSPFDLNWTFEFHHFRHSSVCPKFLHRKWLPKCIPRHFPAPNHLCHRQELALDCYDPIGLNSYQGKRATALRNCQRDLSNYVCFRRRFLWSLFEYLAIRSKLRRFPLEFFVLPGILFHKQNLSLTIVIIVIRFGIWRVVRFVISFIGWHFFCWKNWFPSISFTSYRLRNWKLAKCN